jgi:hypothetical protein
METASGDPSIDRHPPHRAELLGLGLVSLLGLLSLIWQGYVHPYLRGLSHV